MNPDQILAILYSTMVFFLGNLCEVQLEKQHYGKAAACAGAGAALIYFIFTKVAVG